MIQRRLRSVHPGPNRGVKQAGFVVLDGAFMPAVLVELGFISNSSEERMLADRAAQLLTGVAILSGILTLRSALVHDVSSEADASARVAVLAALAFGLLPAALASVLLTVQPVGSVLLGMWLLAEAPSAFQLLGVVLIIAGLLIGLFVCWLQLEFHLVKFGNDFIVPYYPIELQLKDFVWLFLLIMFIGFVAALYPVRVFTRMRVGV